jgi:hypothetical protein
MTSSDAWDVVVLGSGIAGLAGALAEYGNRLPLGFIGLGLQQSPIVLDVGWMIVIGRDAMTSNLQPQQFCQ